jgi:hypothetical protein
MEMSRNGKDSRRHDVAKRYGQEVRLLKMGRMPALMVIGEKEKFGGDLAFPIKMRSYWMPVETPAAEQEPPPTPARSPCGGR